MSTVAFHFCGHTYLPFFSDILDRYITMYFHRNLYVFWQICPLIAIFDFAETTFCTIFHTWYYSRAVRHNGSWKFLIHIVKQENIRHPILCSRITENTRAADIND